MAKFGWCLTSHHALCIVRHQKFYIGPVGKGRKKKQGIIMLNEWAECDCLCHRKDKK